MTTLPSLVSRSFHARTLRVQSVARIEATIDLDFGVMIRRTIVLDGLTLPRDMPDDLRQRAKHCLVVLIGGKRLVIRPDARSRDRWNSMPEIPSRVYLAERVCGKPIGFIETLPDANGSVLELAPYLTWLATQHFDVDLVKETMNGGN